MNDRPVHEDEIEVTDEMNRAGAEIIDRWARDIQEGWVNAHEVAPLVWSAMMKCARSC